MEEYKLKISIQDENIQVKQYSGEAYMSGTTYNFEDLKNNEITLYGNIHYYIAFNEKQNLIEIGESAKDEYWDYQVDWYIDELQSNEDYRFNWLTLSKEVIDKINNIEAKDALDYYNQLENVIHGKEPIEKESYSVDNTLPTLYFAFGPSGAGKSYFCNELKEALSGGEKDCLHISSDDIRDNYAKTQYKNGNPAYVNSQGKPIYSKAESKHIFDEMTKQIIDGLNEGKDVISDRVITANFLKEKFLKEIICDERLEVNINLNLVQVTNSKDNCIKNVDKRNAQETQNFVPLDVVNGIFNTYEKMTSEDFKRITRSDNMPSCVKSKTLTTVDKVQNIVTEYSNDSEKTMSKNDYLDSKEGIVENDYDIDDVE